MFITVPPQALSGGVWKNADRGMALVPAEAEAEAATPITGSWATLIASGSSRTSIAGAEAAPGGTGAGRYVTLVSCQMAGAAAQADSGQRKKQ